MRSCGSINVCVGFFKDVDQHFYHESYTCFCKGYANLINDAIV